LIICFNLRSSAADHPFFAFIRSLPRRRLGEGASIHGYALVLIRVNLR